MANSNSTMIHKLQRAINSKGEKLTYSTTQFYSNEQDRPVTKYTIKKAVYDERTQKNHHIELFSAYSQIQIVLFLRDYWYRLNGLPLPEANEVWNEIRAELRWE